MHWMKVRLATNYINSHPVAAIYFPNIPASRDRHFASTDHKGSRICSVLTDTVSCFVAITSSLRRANEKKSCDSDQEACFSALPLLKMKLKWIFNSQDGSWTADRNF
jgi:hypothetical protein